MTEEKLKLQEEAYILFHKLWTNNVGKDGYDKQQWIRLRDLLYKLGVSL